MASSTSATTGGGSHLKPFLSRHFVEDSNDPVKPVTNTRIKSVSHNVSGGKYHISDTDYPEFLRVYHQEVFVDGRPEYLTEVQPPNGPIVVDLDFRYDFAVQERQHNNGHLEDLVCLYLAEIQKVFAFADGDVVESFVFQKPNVNRVVDKQITKDGIHLMLSILADRTTQMLLRERILHILPEQWSDLPIVNQWNDVLDAAVSSGNSNWQLVGSCKPGHERYELIAAEKHTFDGNDKQFVSTLIEFGLHDDTAFARLFPRLSVRHNGFSKFPFTPSFQDTWTAAAGGGATNGFNGSRKRKHDLSATTGAAAGSGAGPVAYGLHFDNRQCLSIRDESDLTAVLDLFLNSIPEQEHELRDIYEYAMALPESYYDPYPEWIRVGWALRNVHYYMLIVWIAFSAKSSKFSYADIGLIFDEWEKMSFDPMNGLTRRSIVHWAKVDAHDKYLAIKENSLTQMIEMTISSSHAVVSSERGSGGGGFLGSTDFDLAKVLHHMFKDEYVCASIKGNLWYHFCDHRWEIMDSGTQLRLSISCRLRNEYYRVLENIQSQLQRIIALDADVLTDDDKMREKALKLKYSRATEITAKLGKTREKNNIMTEAKELFYDRHFLRKLDSNKYLLCFANGVVDFSTKEVRRGYPEDYVSKTTGIDYVSLRADDAAQNVIMAEILDFMRKLFPKPELEQYMWHHLASALIGTCGNQTFNMYVGVGQNGKSVLVNLMEHALGEYKGNVPLTLITQQRTKVGGLAPELVALKGVRYAVMQEPSKGDKINEGIMKELTSGVDKITCRAPFMPEMVTYEPQFKLVVCSNELMEIKSNDHGTWRRIRVVDFLSLFTENPVEGDVDKPYQYAIDKNIMEKFGAWKEVFASMLVETAFQTNGMVEDCESVMQSSNKYRQSQDFMALFTSDRIVKDPLGSVSMAQLNQDFRAWFQEMYGRGYTGQVREVHGYVDKMFGKMRVDKSWHGFRMRNDNTSTLYNDEDAAGVETGTNSMTTEDEEEEDLSPAAGK